MSGFVNGGDPVIGVKCPRCGDTTVVYNGNYWCYNEGTDNGSRYCWIMDTPDPGEERNPADKHIIKTYLLQRKTEYQKIGDFEGRKRMDFYLNNMEAT